MFTEQELNAHLNAAYRARADKTTALLRLLLTLSATLLTALLPLCLFSTLSRSSRICLCVAAVCLFACGACSIVGLLYEIRQEHNKIRNLLYTIATLRTAGRGSGGFGDIVGGLVVVPFAATAIALLCLAAALAALSAALFQTFFS